MGVPVYDKNKYYRIMDRTQSNYANQLKRLTKNRSRSDFILIYYSLLLIINSLSVKFYPNLFDETWSSYTNIILSTIVLIYSIINSKADYPNRISKIQTALNEVKRLKREMGAMPAELVSSNQSAEAQEAYGKFSSIKDEYDKVVSGTEVRDDLDFFHTIRQLCKQHGLNPMNGEFKRGYRENSDNAVVVEEIRGYISEINPVLQWGYIILLAVFHLVLYLIPIIILGLSIVFKIYPLARIFGLS